MKSLYFDDSLYENKMHYKIAKYLEEMPELDDEEEIHIKCSNEEEYNNVLDTLFKYGDGKIKMYGVSYDPMEIIVEPDPRDKYRKFDEETFLAKKENN